MATNPARNISKTIDGRIVVILMMAAALRLAWIATLPSDDASLKQLPDQNEYLELGRNLATHQGLKFFDPRFGQTVFAYRSPGYPFLIAVCQGDVQLIRVAQALLDAASVFAVYLLASALSRKRQGAALFAAGIIALNPFLIYFCGLILSETLFTAMLAWGMVLLVVPRKRIGWWCGAILLAMSVLVRPSAILLPCLLCAVSTFLNRETAKPYQWLSRAAIAALMTILVLLPWAWRNDRVVGGWIWTTTNTGVTAYDGYNPDATGASDQRFIQKMPELQSMDEVGRSQYLAKAASIYVREHPIRAVELLIVKIARLWSPIPLSSGNSAKVVGVAVIYMIPLYVLVVLGLWRGENSGSIKLYLMAPAIYLTLVHAASVGSLRYRLPADVPMAIVAAMAFCAPPPKRQELEL